MATRNVTIAGLQLLFASLAASRTELAHSVAHPGFAKVYTEIPLTEIAAD